MSRSPLLSTLRPLALVTAACIGSGCESGAADQSTVEMTDSAGVAIVRNLRAASDTVRLQSPIASAGDREGDERHAFQYLQGITPLPDGSVLLVDRAPRLAIFDSAGEWIRDLGRVGGGPGEFRQPAWATVRGDTIDVWDLGLQRLVSFTTDGAAHGARRIGPPGLGFRARPFAGGFIDKQERGQYQSPGPAEGFLLRRTADGAIGDTLMGPYPVPKVGWQLTDQASGAGMMVNPPALSIDPPWVVWGDRIAWTAGTDPRVEVRDVHGALERVIELPRQPRAVSSEDRERYLTAMAHRFGMDAPSRERLRSSTDFAERMPLVAALRADDAGRLWVAVFDPAVPLGGRAAEWDVLDGNGRLLHRVIFPRHFELHVIQGARAYGIRTDADGVQVMEVYALPER